MQPYLPGGSQGQTERPTCEITPSAASQEAAGSSVALTAVENPPDAAILAVEVSSGLQLEGHSRRPTFSVPTARPDVQYVAVVGYPGGPSCTIPSSTHVSCKPLEVQPACEQNVPLCMNSALRAMPLNSISDTVRQQW